ncbi:protein FAR1-RELATED SEQUENCE 5-like [Aegilops tauschii subsp. strangulata]|uniref:protein FAR1-RELATED SEQUENCE 5-like n=1 Tax=Aegilops tauschii subsp. strangulata TaxID=200361 RepID=UPI003CC86CC9
MGGVAPENIITSQNFAMRSAIDEVFLNIIHRNCRWHIMKKAQEKLGKPMDNDKPLNKAFKDCRQQLDWLYYLGAASLEQNQITMEKMCGHKMLGPDVLHDAFLSILAHNCKERGFNAVLKKYVNPNNSLIEFATQYTAIQEKVMVAVAKEQVEMKLKTAYGCDTLQNGVPSGCGRFEGYYRSMGIGTTMCRRTRMKGYTHALAASLIAMGYCAHTYYE